MTLLRKILGDAKLSQEEIEATEALKAAKAAGAQVVDGTGAPADASRGQEFAPLDPASGGKPDADNPEVKDKAAGAKTDPDAPATVDSPADAGKDAGSTTGAGKKDETDVNNSADIAGSAKVSKEDDDANAVEVEPEVAAEVAAALDPEDEVIAEIDEVGEETEEATVAATDIGHAEDDVASLQETVATMEAMINRGFVSEGELFICAKRGQRILKRYDVYIPSVAQENLSSEEGRLDQMAQTARDMAMATEGIVDGIKAGWAKLKEKVSSAMTRLVSVNARLTARAQRLEAACGAIDKSAAKGSTVKLPRDVHRFLTDEAGKLLPADASAGRLLAASKEILSRYPMAVAKAAKGQNPGMNKGVLARLPAGLTMSTTSDGYPIFRTTRLSDKADRSAAPVVAPTQLAKIVGNVRAVLDVLEDKNMGLVKALEVAQATGDEDSIKRVDMMVSHLLDFYFYAQRVAGALLGYVATQVAQYGVKAKA